ncbi:MAG: CvpA family protein [Xanthobacteraceae bacterium]|nr:CvpA family protein [Xanthobacteraceae bacterium]MBX3523191.1 CvpA family protein [Xanthobacteraceae bacterium]MBX3534165.1 CvpA family protein [Xanthobacteraceae bacterium]MBX3550601.1 CvpA family protein [Xanthobacteraceae bacterium]MCW5674334.1 CvpA family protein [Xanthobacteraceae bacterium]
MTPTVLDFGLLAVMLISGVLAMVRGFMREILSIASWVIAAIVTLYGYSRVLPYVKQYVHQDLLATGIAVGGLFLLTLLIVSLFTVKISDLVLDSRIGALDRTLGFLFGLARGLVVMVVAFLFFTWLVPAKTEPDWVKNARSRPILQSTGDWIKSVLPDDPENAILQRLRKPRGDEQQTPAPETTPNPAPTPQPGRTDRGNNPSLANTNTPDEKTYKRNDRAGFNQLIESTRAAQQ